MEYEQFKGNYHSDPFNAEKQWDKFRRKHSHADGDRENHQSHNTRNISKVTTQCIGIALNRGKH